MPLNAALKRRVASKSTGKISPVPAGTGTPGASGASCEDAGPAPDHPPTRSARRAQRTRTRLEAAALSTFVEVGVGATTIEMITERADLGKGTFYQHFSTKEELLAHLVEEAVDRLIGRISKAIQGQRDLRCAIGAIVNAHLDYFQTNREEFILFFQGHGVVNLLGTAPEDLESAYLKYLEKLEDFIRERLPATPGDVTLRRMACAIAGFAVGYLSFAVLGLSEDNLRETYRPVRDSLINGLTTLVERALGAPATSAEPAPAPGPANPPSEKQPPMTTTPP
jgi:AcrR family transcriptional regulator